MTRDISREALSMDEGRGALFRSAHAALRFAFEFTHGTVKKSALAKMMGGPVPAGRGLAGLDGAAQAGMIKQEVASLPTLHRNIVIARLAEKAVECLCGRACCKGSVENPEWAEAVDYLTQLVLVEGLTGTVSHYRLRRALVKRFFGVRDNMEELAKLCRLNKNTVTEYNKNVVEHLRREERLAMYAIEAKLKEKEIIE